MDARTWEWHPELGAYVRPCACADGARLPSCRFCDGDGREVAADLANVSLGHTFVCVDPEQHVALRRLLGGPANHVYAAIANYLSLPVERRFAGERSRRASLVARQRIARWAQLGHLGPSDSDLVDVDRIVADATSGADLWPVHLIAGERPTSLMLGRVRSAFGESVLLACRDRLGEFACIPWSGIAADADLESWLEIPQALTADWPSRVAISLFLMAWAESREPAVDESAQSSE